MQARDIWIAPPTHNSTPLPSSGRAGRNLPAAITSALVLVGALGATLFFSRPIFLVLVTALVLAAIWEVAGALARKDIIVSLPPLYVGAIAMMATGATVGAFWVMASLYFTFVAAVLWRLASTSLPSRPVYDIMATSFLALYVPFSASFLAMISAHSEQPWTLVFFVVIVACNDLGGWAAGVLFGKHPMAPKLSPKKSWEGFVGSVLLTCGAAVGATFVIGIPWWWCFVLGLGAAIIGTLGDLTESLVKRQVGLKDMSNMVPGHGGLMDRFDSMLFCAPAFFFFYAIALGWVL